MLLLVLFLMRVVCFGLLIVITIFCIVIMQSLCNSSELLFMQTSVGSTRFHTSAQETVGSGVFVSAWLFLENTIPLQQWRKMEPYHQNSAGGNFCHIS